VAKRAAGAYIPFVSSTEPKMADGTSKIVPKAPAKAMTPAGINHLVINVRDMDESHRFWTEILGFKEVGRSSRRNMRFYSGDHDGLMNHQFFNPLNADIYPRQPTTSLKNGDFRRRCADFC
jgi:hypothetical protein